MKEIARARCNTCLEYAASIQRHMSKRIEKKTHPSHTIN